MAISAVQGSIASSLPDLQVRRVSCHLFMELIFVVLYTISKCKEIVSLYNIELKTCTHTEHNMIAYGKNKKLEQDL